MKKNDKNIMIDFKGITKRYRDFVALNDASFQIKKGKVTALLGPNGAGKTTAMKILTGFMSADGGKVEIDNKILTEKNRIDLQSRIGYLPENAPLFPELNVWEHLNFTSKIHGISKSDRSKVINDVAEKCGLSKKLFFDISELSKGYKQRVGLAQAIIHDPEILILDEPTTGLDPNQISEIRSLIASWKGEKTILISTHIMQEVDAMADEVVLISDGKVVFSGNKNDLSFAENKSLFCMQIEIDGSKTHLAKLQKYLNGLDLIQKVEVINSIVLAYSDKDCRAEIARGVINNNIDLIGLAIKKASMEDIFRDLTQK